MKELEIGGIYLTEWDERSYRIIGLDEIEVFYDCLWSHDNSWAFSGNFRKKCYFYRTASPLFAKKSNRQDIQTMTNEEQRFFRPDLLMRIGRIKDLNWNGFAQKNFQDFRDYIHLNVSSEILNQKLDIEEIIVLPSGPKGGFKKGEKLTANNNEFFTVSELLWKSKAIQEAVNSERSNGVGLYRIGFEKGLPSYYIGEYIDKAGLLKV